MGGGGEMSNVKSFYLFVGGEMSNVKSFYLFVGGEMSNVKSFYLFLPATFSVGRNLSNIKHQTVKPQSHSWLKTSLKQLKLFLISAYVARTISTQPTQTTL